MKSEVPLLGLAKSILVVVALDCLEVSPSLEIPSENITHSGNQVPAFCLDVCVVHR